MIDSFRRIFLNIRYPYKTLFDRERASTLLTINFVLAAVWVFVILTATLPNIFLNAGRITPANIYTLVFWVPLVIVYLLVQTGRLETAVRLFILLMLSVSFPILTIIEVPAMPVMLVLPIAAMTALLPRRRQLRLMVLVVIILGARLYLQSQYTRTIRLTPADTIQTDMVLFSASLGFGAVMLLVASGSNSRLEARSERASSLMRAVGGYRALVAGIYDDDRVFVRALEMLQIDLRYTLASAYRLNEAGTFTRLRLGGVGQDISRSEIRLNEDVTAVGEAARRLQIMIASIYESGTLGAHIVPPARWSISLPIVRDGVVLGMLDIQTERADGFDDNEREGFGILVDQIAGALVEARDFRELRRVNREQEELLQRYRGQLVQSEQRSQQMFINAWDRYVQGRTASGQTEGFGFDLMDVNAETVMTAASDLPPDIQAALATGDVHIEQTPDAQIVRAPVSFRNQTMGALSFRVPKNRPLTDRQIDLLRTVATRLGVALENNRLFEQSQAQALRERKVGEIGSTLITATDIDSLLNLAARSFNEALGAVATRVTLEPSRFAEMEREALPVTDGSANGYTNGNHNNGNEPDRSHSDGNGNHP